MPLIPLWVSEPPPELRYRIRVYPNLNPDLALYLWGCMGNRTNNDLLVKLLEAGYAALMSDLEAASSAPGQGAIPLPASSPRQSRPSGFATPKTTPRTVPVADTVGKPGETASQPRLSPPVAAPVHPASQPSPPAPTPAPSPKPLQQLDVSPVASPSEAVKPQPASQNPDPLPRSTPATAEPSPSDDLDSPGPDEDEPPSLLSTFIKL